MHGASVAHIDDMRRDICEPDLRDIVRDYRAVFKQKLPQRRVLCIIEISLGQVDCRRVRMSNRRPIACISEQSRM